MSELGRGKGSLRGMGETLCGARGTVDGADWTCSLFAPHDGPHHAAGREWVGDEGPPSACGDPSPVGWAHCTIPHGHDGPHQAWGETETNRVLRAYWERRETGEAKSTMTFAEPSSTYPGAGQWVLIGCPHCDGYHGPCEEHSDAQRSEAAPTYREDMRRIGEALGRRGEIHRAMRGVPEWIRHAPSLNLFLGRPSI